ncbi:MAG TPA: cell division protein FtsZ [Candidatus Acidoferrales bacterium]|jgi:cell division protein FtsZ|nr:cell division protein FtsZ [Candidatus Acidoferrales bacterium]
MGLIDSNMDDLKYEIEEEARLGTRIKIIGVGGGGCNAVARMVQEGLEGVQFYAMNTDLQALSACNVPNKLQLGAKVTNGLGAGSNAEIGRQAALENTDRIVEILQDSDMVFVTAGLGGGTGTGAAPVIASLAKELDALTIAVVTKPFGFEGARRMRLAEEGLGKLASTVDTVIAIPNDRLLALVPRGTSFFESFKVADDLLRQAVQGISDIIITPGLINRDFSDIRATMLGMGYAMMGTAIGRGEKAAVDAARQAISSPLLEDSRIAGSRGILINITGSSRLGLHEVNEACSIIREAADCDDVQINFGVILNEAMADAVKITVIATGFQPDHAPVAERRGTVAPVVRVQPRPPEPEPAIEHPPAPQPQLQLQIQPQAGQEAILLAEPDPVLELDLDDLDTPAYLRQGRLLN